MNGAMWAIQWLFRVLQSVGGHWQNPALPLWWGSMWTLLQAAEQRWATCHYSATFHHEGVIDIKICNFSPFCWTCSKWPFSPLASPWSSCPLHLHAWWSEGCGWGWGWAGCEGHTTMSAPELASPLWPSPGQSPCCWCTVKEKRNTSHAATEEKRIQKNH